MKNRSMSYYIRRARLRAFIAKRNKERKIAAGLPEPANENTREVIITVDRMRSTKRETDDGGGD
jgi:hypothetical protein